MAATDPLKENEVPDVVELGQFYFINRRYAEAREAFERVLAVDAGNIQAVFGLGLIEEATNRPDAAAALFKQVLSRDPEHARARRHLEKLVGI